MNHMTPIDAKTAGKCSPTWTTTSPELCVLKREHNSVVRCLLTYAQEITFSNSLILQVRKWRPRNVNYKSKVTEISACKYNWESFILSLCVAFWKSSWCIIVGRACAQSFSDNTAAWELWSHEEWELSWKKEYKS